MIQGNREKVWGEDEINKIKHELSTIRDFHPGKISQQYTVCNKPNCRCKSKTNPVKHGPYYQLSYSVKGKHSTRFIKADQVEHVQQYINEYHRVKALLNDLTEAYVNQFKVSGWT